MKIIDNKKDYYDYLSGVYGIDEKIVYDRRGSIPAYKILENEKLKPFFDKSLMDLEHGYKRDAYDHPIQFYENAYKKFYSKATFYIIVEAGKRHYYIDVVRYRMKKDDPITISFSGMTEEEYWKKRWKSWNEEERKWKWNREILERDEKESKKKISNAPLAIIFKNNLSENWYLRNNPIIYENPILKDIPGLSGAVDATWIWESIYEYLGSLKDKEIIDTRTDVQKLESAGFDKKTSFRKM